MAKARRKAVAKRRPGQRKRQLPASEALQGIKQGVGRSVRYPFGGYTVGYHPRAFDAFHFAHMALPRAVGPYTVVRTTNINKLESALAVIGTIRVENGEHGSNWSSTNGLTWAASSLGTETMTNCGSIKNGQIVTGAWDGAQVVPSAMSVQIMCGASIQTAKGILYIGRLRTAWAPSEHKTDKVKDVAENFVTFNNPRLCAAAKLCFRGVQVDLVPYNMSSLSDFANTKDEGNITTITDDTDRFNGFAPIFIYNPEKLPVQVLICTEWRVRFDPSNPAQATHHHHPPSSESAWAKAQCTMESMGNGVIDIANRVAQTGNAVFQAAGGIYNGVQGVRALRALANEPRMLALAA